MSRKIKNIVIICTILILTGTSYLTMYTGIINKVCTKKTFEEEKKQLEIIENITKKPSSETPNGSPPPLSEGEKFTENGPPPLPEGVTPNNPPPEGEYGGPPDGSTPPPEMFDDGYTKESPPILPEREDLNNNNKDTLPNNVKENNYRYKATDNSKYFPVYCILFFIQNILLSSLITYLCMTKFNKVKISKKQNKIIICSSILLLTIILTFIEGYVLNKNSKEQIEFITFETIDTSTIDYNSIKNIKNNEKISDKLYGTKEKDELVLLVNGNITTEIKNTTIEKYGASTDSDDANMYGFNSGILIKSGAKAKFDNITVNTYGASSNGVFCLGNNDSKNPTTVTITNSKITTKTYNSGGIMTSLGGVLNAKNLIITTSGMSSAAIRTDHGGGNVNVDGGTYTTTGPGSPAVYSTGKVSIKNAKLVSNTSEGIAIDGNNSVTLNRTELTTNNTKLVGKSTEHNAIFIHQSFDNIKRKDNANFTSKNSIINVLKGNTFFITNTDVKIELVNNKITNLDKNGNFLVIKAGDWGVKNKNGGNVKLLMSEQSIIGNIVIDELSELKMTMKNDSSYEGTINKDNKAKNIELKLDKTSKIKLTSDSYITSLENADKKNTNIDFNGFKLYVNGKLIN